MVRRGACTSSKELSYESLLQIKITVCSIEIKTKPFLLCVKALQMSKNAY